MKLMLYKWCISMVCCPLSRLKLFKHLLKTRSAPGSRIHAWDPCVASSLMTLFIQSVSTHHQDARLATKYCKYDEETQRCTPTQATHQNSRHRFRYFVLLIEPMTSQVVVKGGHVQTNIHHACAMVKRYQKMLWHMGSGHPSHTGSLV